MLLLLLLLKPSCNLRRALLPSLRRSTTTKATTTTTTRRLSSSAAPSSNCFPAHPAFLPIAQPRLELELGEVGDSFIQWFKEGAANVALLDLIYHALASSADDHSLEAALSRIQFRLSESLVFRVLRHRPNPSHPNLLLLRLKFFDWSGRQPAYRHSRAAYHAIFRILSRSSLSSVVLDWLRLFSSQRFGPHRLLLPTGPHPRLHDTLVVGYSVAGRPDLALPIIARIRFQGLDLDSFSYHVLTNALVDSSAFDLAESLLSHLKSQGLAGPVSDAIRIKSLCRQNKLDHALLFLRDLAASSHRRELTDRAVATLVQALCARRRFRDAGLVISEFGGPQSYGVWIAELVSAGRLDAAMDLLRAKKETEAYVPQCQHYNKIISQLIQKNRLDKVYDLLVEMREEGVAPDRATMNAALCFFCKAGMVDVAVQLYNSRVELGFSPNKLVYNHLITALCREGSVDEVCLVLEESMKQGYFPGRETFNILANLLCREGKLDKVRKLLDGALQRDTRPRAELFARYIAALCKAGQVEEACWVPRIVSGENAGLGRFKYTYTSLIHAFISLRRVDVLPQLIIEMQDHGHVPSRCLYREVISCLCEMGKFDDVLNLLNKQLEHQVPDKHTSYNYFIDGAAHAKKPELAREVYNRMRSSGVEPTMHTNILLLQSYLKSGRIADALGFFYSLMEKREPSTKLYNVFITGLCEAGKPEQAVVFWREVREKGLIPSLQCYEELVLTLCSSKDYDIVVKILNDLKETGRQVSSFLCNVLLLHTLKTSDLLHAWIQHKKGDRDNKAEQVGQDNPGSGRLMLGQLIAAFSGGIRLKDNLDNLDDVVEKYFPVDIFTYNMLLRGLTMTGRMDYACNFFHRIRKKGYEPNRWSFDIIVHGFCKQGRRKDAERWMVEMYRNGFHPTCLIASIIAVSGQGKQNFYMLLGQLAVVLFLFFYQTMTSLKIDGLSHYFGRRELVVMANVKTQKVASGLSSPVLAHLKVAQEQIRKRGHKGTNKDAEWSCQICSFCEHPMSFGTSGYCRSCR